MPDYIGVYTLLKGARLLQVVGVQGDCSLGGLGKVISP